MNVSGASSQEAMPQGREDDVFHVVFCVDDRYFRCMGATISSLIDNNRQRRFAFHVLATKVNDENRRRLASLGEQPPCTLR